MEKQTKLPFVSKRKGIESEDHKGNKYPNFSAMCEAYDQAPTTVKKRLACGMSLRDALETKGHRIDLRPRRTGPCYDHLGIKYVNAKARAKAYGKPQYTISYRMDVLGWSLKDALTIPAFQGGKRECVVSTQQEDKSITDIEQIKERQRQGIEAAQKRGVRFGRPAVLTKAQFLYWYDKVQAGEMSAGQAIREMKVARATFYRFKNLYVDVNNVVNAQEQELKEAQMKALNEIAKNNAQEQETKIISCLNATEAKLEHIYEFAQYPHQFTSGEAVEGLLVAINTRSAQPFFCDGDEKAYALIREVK